MGRSVLIIGAGIAGLSAGCYAQMNGYRARIVEAQSLPGGSCVPWRRDGFTFGGFIRWVEGTSPANPYYRMWRELGAVDDPPNPPRTVKELLRVESADGQSLSFYTDVDQLHDHLMDRAPEDRDQIGEFIRGIRGMARLRRDLPSPPERREGVARTISSVRHIAHYPRLRRWSPVTIGEFAEDFDHPLLKEAFRVSFGYPGYPVLAMMKTLADMHRGGSGPPPGPSSTIAERLERRFVELGGSILYNHRVTRILLEEGQAVGVRLSNGEEFRADVVISAADGRSSIFEWLDGYEVSGPLRTLYAQLPVAPSQVAVSLGLHHPLSGYPPDCLGLSLFMDEPILVDGKKCHHMTMHVKPAGQTDDVADRETVFVLLESTYDCWRDRADDAEAYETEKSRIAEAVVSAINTRFPGTAASIDALDVATPLSWYHATHNWQGSSRGWLLTPATQNLRLPRTLPRVSRFYMAGHWVVPGGGLAAAALSGHQAVQMLCRADHKKFTSTAA